jgi:hypothetical protein
MTLPLSLILIIIALLNIFYSYKKYHNNIKTIISVWVLIYMLYVFFVPSVYGVFTDFNSSISYGINPNNLVLVYFLEIIFICILLLTFYKAPSKRISVVISKIIPSMSVKSTVNLLLFLSIIVLVLHLDKILGGLVSYGQLVKYDSSTNQEAIGGFFGVPLKFWAPISAIFMEPGKIAAALLVTMPYNSRLSMSKHKFKIYKFFALGVLIMVAIYGIAIGVRHITLGVFIIIAVAGVIHKRNKFIYMFIFGLIAMILIGPVIGSVYRVLLTQSSSSELGVVDRISILSDLKSESSENAFNKLWDEFGVRLVDARLSTGLIQFTDREGHVGLNVIANTLTAPVPRFLFSDKPAPRSYNGMHEGLAGYVVWNELTGRKWGLWGGYTAASHSWWEMSLLGVFLCAFIYGLFLRITVDSTAIKGLVGSLIVLYSINILHFDSFFMRSIPDLMMFFSRLMPLLIFIALWSKISRIKFVFSRCNKKRKGYNV